MKTKEERQELFAQREAARKAKYAENMQAISDKHETRMAEIKAAHPTPTRTKRPSLGERTAYRYKVAASVENISHGLGGLAFVAWDGLPECVEVWGTTHWKPQAK